MALYIGAFIRRLSFSPGLDKTKHSLLQSTLEGTVSSEESGKIGGMDESCPRVLHLFSEVQNSGEFGPY